MAICDSVLYLEDGLPVDGSVVNCPMVIVVSGFGARGTPGPISWFWNVWLRPMGVILLMEEILHHLGSIKPFK